MSESVSDLPGLREACASKNAIILYIGSDFPNLPQISHQLCKFQHTGYSLVLKPYVLNPQSTSPKQSDT